MLRVAIVEDDPTYIQRIADYLNRFQRETNQKLSVSAFADGIDIVEEYKPEWDIIFLDIEMPLLNGLSAAQRIRDQDAKVVLIFITNMAQYAIHGYEVEALDFMLKPVAYEQFYMKMKKATSAALVREEKHIILHSRDESYPIQIDDIIYVEVINHHLQVITDKGDYTIFDSMNHFEKQLPKQRFARCSQSYLVNLRHIKRVTFNTVSVDKYELSISRSRKKEFMQAVSEYFGGGL